MPILLSTLTLATGVSGLTSAMLAPAPMVVATESSMETVADQVTNIYTEDLYQINQYLKIMEMNFANNNFTFGTGGTHNAEGISARRVLIVMRDYENGVTETEADEKVHTLGLGDDSWYKTITDKKVPASINYTSPKEVKLKDNISDVLYFALQFGHETTNTEGQKVLEDEYWVRGKIDYRKCIHSASFDPETMACAVQADKSTQTAKVVILKDGNYIALPEDEVVLTWEEEWKIAVAERIKTLNTQLTHMKQQLPMVYQTLEQVDTTIANMRKTTAGMSNIQGIKSNLTKLETLSQQVRRVYDWLLGAEQQKNMDDLQTQLNDALAEVERLKAGSTDVEVEIAVARAEIVRLTQVLQETQAELMQHDAEYEAKLQAKQSELQVAGAKLETLQKEVATLKSRIVDLEKKLAGAGSNYETAARALAQAQQELQKIMAEKEAIMQRVQGLIADHEDLSLINKDLAQQAKQLQATETKIKAENQELKEENQAFKAQVETLKAEKTALEQANEDLNTKIKELEAELAKKTSCTVVGEVRVGDKPLNNTNPTETVEATEATEVAPAVEQQEAEAVAVPNLGDVETKTNFWWIAVAIVGALGVLGLCCKKRLDREQ